MSPYTAKRVNGAAALASSPYAIYKGPSTIAYVGTFEDAIRIADLLTDSEAGGVSEEDCQGLQRSIELFEAAHALSLVVTSQSVRRFSVEENHAFNRLIVAVLSMEKEQEVPHV